jgi:GTPase SAR1 family protein
MDTRRENKRLYDETIALLPQRRITELKRDLNIRFGNTANMRQQLTRVRDIVNRGLQAKPLTKFETLEKRARELGFKGRRVSAQQFQEFINRQQAPILPILTTSVGMKITIKYQLRMNTQDLMGRNTYVWMPRRPNPPYFKNFLINSLPLEIKSNIDNLKRRFINANGGEDYCRIISTSYKTTTVRPRHTWLDVPLKRSGAPALQIFNDKGEFIIENEDAGDDLCIPRYIQKHAFPKKTLDKIVEEINVIVNNEIENDFFYNEETTKKYDCRNDGVSLRQFEYYCNEHRLSFRALDCFERMFYRFTHEKRNTNKTCMMFIIHDGHIYDLVDKVLRASVKNMNGQVLTHNNIKEERKEKAKKREINNYMEFTPENLQEALNCDEPIDLYTTDSNVLLNYFYKSYFQGKWLKYKCVGNEMVSLNYKKGCKIIFNEDWKNAEKLCHILDKEFNNQTITSLAIEKLDNDLSLCKSYFNIHTYDFANKIHHSPIVRCFNRITNSSNVKSLDINKMYASIVKNPNMNWLKLNCLSDMLPYDNSDIELDTLYYIEPENNNIIIGDFGVYYPELVKEALEDGLIKRSEIKFMLRCEIVSTEIFSNFVDDVYSTCGEFSKNCVNNFIGCLGKTKKVVGAVYYTSDINTACSDFFIKDENRFVCEVASEGDKHIYATDNITEKDNNKNLFMIRKQVVQQGNLLAYRLRKKMGGKLIKISTDCVSVEYNEDEIKDSLNQIPLSTEMGGLKIEKKLPRISDEIDNNVCRKYKINDIVYSSVNQIEINDEYNFEEIYSKIQGKSFFLTGNGGVGKSWVAKQLKKRIEDEGKTIRVMSPTWIATKLLDATTCHNGMGYDIHGKTHTSNYSSVDVLMIDEISMLTTQFYNELCEIKKDYPNMIFIASGDFNQLPPVGEEHIDFENTEVFRILFPNKITLKINKRNSTDGVELFKITEDLLNGHNITDRLQNIKYSDALNYNLHLTFTNRKRQEINNKLMLNHRGESYMEIIKDEQSETNSDYSQTTYLYEGLPLRCRKSEKKGDISIKNGDQFIVKSLDEKNVILMRDNTKFSNYNKDDEVEEITYPITGNFINIFNPNYAMTVHNSQCQSFDEHYVMWECEKYTVRMLNTAIGRSRKLEYIHFV